MVSNKQRYSSPTCIQQSENIRNNLSALYVLLVAIDCDLLTLHQHNVFMSLGVSGSICITKMYLSYWKPPGVSERMWSVNLDVSISGEYQTLEGHSSRPLE